MTEPHNAIIARILARAPEWLKHELLSNDPSLRTRAEETLAAMIAAALQEPGETG